MHRFAGAASGRKELMAAALAEALDLDALPAPLAGLLDAICTRPTSQPGRYDRGSQQPQRHTGAEGRHTVEP